MKILLRVLDTNILRNIFSSYVIIMLGTVLGFLTRLFLARLAGPVAYGHYAYSLSISNILLFISLFGTVTLSLRMIPRFIVNNDWHKLKGYIRFSQYLVLLLASLIAVGFIIVVWVYLRPGIELDLLWTLGLVPFLLFVDAFLNLTSNYLIAYKRVVAGQFPISILRTLGQIAFILLLLGIGYPYKLGAAILLSYLVGTIYALFANLYFLKSTHPTDIHDITPSFETVDWLKTTAPFAGQSILHIITQQVDVLLLGIFLNTTVAGIYSVAVLMALPIKVVMNAITFALAPRYSEEYTKGNTQELQRIASQSVLITTIFSASIFIFNVVAGRFLLSLFGQPFTAGYYPLLIISFGYLINGSAGSTGLLMNISRYGTNQIFVLFVTTIISFASNLVLIPKYGMMGAACSFTLTIFVQQTILVLYLSKHLKVNPSIFGFKIL